MKYLKLIGIGAFIYIVSSLDFELVHQSLANLRLAPIIFYCISFFAFFLLKSYRWHLIQTHFSKPLRFRENLWLQIETVYLSYVTPAKIGDLAKIWIMKSEFNIDKKDSIFPYTYDRLQDLIILIFYTFISLFFILEIEVSIYLFLIMTCFVCFYFAKNQILKFVEKRLNRKIFPKVNIIFEIKMLALSAIIFAIFFLQVFMLSKAMGLNISYFFLVALLSISSIVVLIPISIAGLGVREGVYVYMLSTIDITGEEAVVLSLLDNLVFAPIFIVLLHFFSKFWLKKVL